MNTRPPISARPPEGPRRSAELPPALARRMSGPRSTMAQEEAPKCLTVPPEVLITGEIRDAEEVKIEGRIEADLKGSRVLDVAEKGSFVGTAEVEVADIHGRVEGTLTVTKQLLIRASGRVIGRVRYRDLYIEAGGRLAGQVDALDPDQQGELPASVTGNREG
ncbi:MAG: polymer-forming cytoskeletal protein [Pseudomonadota bacterium]